MGSGASLLVEIGNSIGLEDEVALLRGLAELGRKWVELGRNVEGFTSAAALISRLADAPNDPNVAKALTALGAADLLASLQSKSGKIKKLLDAVPETLTKLLDPISAFDEQSGSRDSGLVRWPFLDRKAATSSDGTGQGASYALSLGVEGALLIEAGDTWPYSDPMPGPLLRMRAEGGLKPKASTTLPFTGGSFVASADASAACALEYYFAVPNTGQLYALAVAERLGDLVDPFDFDSVFDAFARSDLAGLHYEFDGDAQIDVAVSVADATSLGALINAELGATIKVSVDLSGHFYLTFRAGPRRADGERSVVAALSRQRSRSGTLGLKLGATIDLAALATQVHGILAEALGKWDGVLGEIKPFLSPGTWLQKKAASLVDDEATKLVKDKALRAALVRDLEGVIGVGEPDELAIVAWVNAQLTGAVDFAQSWTRDRAKAAASVVDTLGRNLPAFAQDKVRTKLQGAAERLVGHAADALKTRVNELFAARQSELNDAMHKVGAAVDARVQSADAALESVRALIDRYDALFRKIVAATGDAARAKISAAVQIEESRVASTTLEVAGTFLTRSDQARRIFRALTTGDFRTLLKLVETGGAGADFALDLGNSSLRRYASSKSSLGLEVVMFGFGFTGQALLSAEASVLVDGTGKVQVDTRAMLQKRFTALDAEREIELISSFSLVRARALTQAGAPPSSDRSIGLALTLGHVDEGLKRQEVDRFVGSLVSAGLVSDEALALAQSTFTNWAGTPGSNGKVAGVLQVKLALDRSTLSALLGLNYNPQPGVLPEALKRWILRIAFDALRRGPQEYRQAIAESLAFLGQELPGVALEDLLLDERRVTRALSIVPSDSRIRRVAQEHETFVEAMSLSLGLYEMIERLRQIYFSTPEAFADNNDYTWGPQDYRKAERRVANSVKGWLQLNNVLFWTDSKVHPKTIGFIETLATIGRIDLASHLSLLMWRTAGPGAAPSTIVLSPLSP